MRNKKLKQGEYLIYRGIIAFIDEVNDDLPTSNNIQFYEYEEGKIDLYDYEFENVLSYEGLLATEDNIKEYIDECLIDDELYRIEYQLKHNNDKKTFNQEELFDYLVGTINGLLEAIQSYEYSEYGDSGCKKFIEKIEKI